MSRPAANLNRYVDGLLQIFKDHAATYPALWANPPVSFVREIGPETADLPSPVLVVSANGEGQAEDVRNLGAQRTRFTLMVAMYLKTQEPDRAAVDALADMWRVITQNRQLKLTGGDATVIAGIDDPTGPTLANGFLSLGSFKIDASAGEAVVQQDVTVQWIWSGDQP